VYTLYTALSMAEAGIFDDELLNWLRNEMEKVKYMHGIIRTAKTCVRYGKHGSICFGLDFCRTFGDEVLLKTFGQNA